MEDPTWKFANIQLLCKDEWKSIQFKIEHKNPDEEVVKFNYSFEKTAITTLQVKTTKLIYPNTEEKEVIKKGKQTKTVTQSKIKKEKGTNDDESHHKLALLD